jgi:integrase
LTPEQIKAFLDAIPETEIMHKTLNMLAVFTGLRQVKILGLKWQDIDFEGSQLEVKRSFTHSDFFKPKSKTSLRKVDIPPALLSQLRKWKLAQQPNSHDLVFATGRGNPIFGNNMPREMFTPYLKKAGLPTVNFHSLRHSYASLLIEQGENIKYIQKQLGHPKAVVTLDIYGHLMKDNNPEASSKLQEKFMVAKR